MELTHSHGLVTRTGKLGHALFSTDGRYRYSLTYRWASGGRRALFGMQNPSTADADKSDRTVTRCIGFAKRLKCSSLVVVNMAAGIATKPADLLKLTDPVGSRNVAVVTQASLGVDFAIAAWGALSPRLRKLFASSIRAFLEMRHVQCLGFTIGGDPRHPLYLSSKVRFLKFPRNAQKR